MFIATFAAIIAMVPATVGDDALKCAVMGAPTTEKSRAIEYAGAKFPFCCGGCDAAFAKEPGKYLADASKSGTTIGMFMFCPVSGEKLDMDKVKETVDYKGMRYGFCCGDCKGAFQKDPAKYAKLPEKESLVCPVSGEKIESYSAASGFVDHEGVRYYLCCGGCADPMKKDAAKVLAGGKAKITKPVSIPFKVKK